MELLSSCHLEVGRKRKSGKEEERIGIGRVASVELIETVKCLLDLVSGI